MLDSYRDSSSSTSGGGVTYFAKVDLCTSIYSASNVSCLLHSRFLWYIFCQLEMVHFHPDTVFHIPVYFDSVALELTANE